MNAISPPKRHPDAAERAGHQLTVCRELADLAMELARAAARRTLQAWQAQEEAEPANADKAAAPARRGPDPGLLFLRFSSAVRQAIALENRIAAGAAPVRGKRASGPSLDARRATLHQLLEEATEDHPERNAVRRDIAERIEQEIAADPDGETHLNDMFGGLCATLGIDVAWNKLPDDSLEKLTSPNLRGGQNHPRLGLTC